MKPQHLFPVFVLALSLPAFGWAGHGPSQKGGCGCSHIQKSSPKGACGCGSIQKGHGIVQKGGVHQKSLGIVQKGGVHQKSHGIVQKGGVHQKSHGIVQKGGPVQKHSKSSCSKGGCSTCCLAVIPAVLNGVDHLVSNTVGHVAAIFACDACCGTGKSKSVHYGGSKS